MVPHTFFPRSKFDVENWMNQSLDHFDAFDEFDHMLGANMHWLQRPSFLEPLPLVPKVPEKYRIQVDCAGFKPESLTIEFKDEKLYVCGNEEVKVNDQDFSIKQFKKSYQLPVNAEIDKMASFLAGGNLIIEVPLKSELTPLQSDLFPRVVKNKDGTKQIAMTCVIPNGIDPARVSVTCKDRDLIVKAEDKIEKPDSMTKFFYYKRCTLPENTDLKALKCHFEENKLLIDAPVNPTLKYHKHQPIEYKPQGVHHKGRLMK